MSLGKTICGLCGHKHTFQNTTPHGNSLQGTGAQEIKYQEHRGSGWWQEQRKHTEGCRGHPQAQAQPAAAAQMPQMEAFLVQTPLLCFLLAHNCNSFGDVPSDMLPVVAIKVNTWAPEKLKFTRCSPHLFGYQGVTGAAVSVPPLPMPPGGTCGYQSSSPVTTRQILWPGIKTRAKPNLKDYARKVLPITISLI